MRKASTTTAKPPACLPRPQGHHQRHHRRVPQHDCIPGVVNQMANDCSRLWHPTDSEFLSCFTARHPQTSSWQLCPLNSEWTSKLILALHRKPSSMESLPKTPSQRMTIGRFGQTVASSIKSTLSCGAPSTPSRISQSLHSDAEMEDLPPAESPSSLNKWREPSVRWGRRSPAWGQGSSPLETHWTARFPNHSTAPGAPQSQCTGETSPPHPSDLDHVPPQPRALRPRHLRGTSPR